MNSPKSEPVPTSEDEKSPKPQKGGAFMQQQVKTVYPIMNARNALPFFFGLGIVFIPIGLGIIVVSEQTTDLVIDYTDCTSLMNPGMKCSDMLNSTLSDNCTCEVFSDGKIGTGWDKDVLVLFKNNSFFRFYLNCHWLIAIFLYKLLDANCL